MGLEEYSYMKPSSDDDDPAEILQKYSHKSRFDEREREIGGNEERGSTADRCS